MPIIIGQGDICTRQCLLTTQNQLFLVTKLEPSKKSVRAVPLSASQKAGYDLQVQTNKGNFWACEMMELSMPIDSLRVTKMKLTQKSKEKLREKVMKPTQILAKASTPRPVHGQQNTSPRAEPKVTEQKESVLDQGDICRAKHSYENELSAPYYFVVKKTSKKKAMVCPIVKKLPNEKERHIPVNINGNPYYILTAQNFQTSIGKMTILSQGHIKLANKILKELNAKHKQSPVKPNKTEIHEQKSKKPKQTGLNRNMQVQKDWNDPRATIERYLSSHVSLGGICTLKDNSQLDPYLSSAKYFIPIYRVPNKMVRIVAVMDTQCPGEPIIISGKEYWAIADIYYTIAPNALRVVPKMRLKDRDETVARICAVQCQPAPQKLKEIVQPGRIKHHNPPIDTLQQNTTLYVYKGLIVCFRNHHPISQVTTTVKDENGDEYKIDIEYCYSCRRKMISYSAYEYYSNILGPLANDIRQLGTDFYDWDYASWSGESVLRQLGYNVSQRDSLSARTRHLILTRAIYNGIMTKTEVLHYLERRMDINGMKAENDIAFGKWLNDYNFVHDYNIEIQPEVYIDSIERY